MKKEVPPWVLIVAVVLVLVVVSAFYIRTTRTPPPMEADPLGSPSKDAALNRGGGASNTPDVGAILQERARQQGAPPGAGAPAGAGLDR